MTPEPQVGQRYLWRRREVVVTALEAGRAVVEFERDGEIHHRHLKPQDLEPLPEHEDFEDSALLAISHHDWEQARARADACARILALKSGKSAEVTNEAKKLEISERQLWRLLKIYQENSTVTAMLAAKAGRPYDLRFLGQEREDLIAECIERDYLKRERPTIKALWRAVESACDAKGVKPPSYRTVRRRVARLLLKKTLSRREGGKVASEVCNGVPGSLEVERLLQRIEIDHTLVDVILRADTPGRPVVGRPWLTIAVDCRSRMVLGFYLSFEPPSVASVAMCLAMCAIQKDAWLAQIGVAGLWPAFGIPTEIWVDNALEFRSEAMRRGCKQHNIILNFRPVGAPRYGGIVERLIGTMMGHVHILPGTTQSSVADLGDYEAEKRAVMTLSEFIPWFTEQVVTQYHLAEHRGLGIPPIKKWEQDLAASDVKGPRDALEFYASFLPARKRSLTRVGVQLACDTYWTDDFGPWIGQKLPVLVHFHRMDAKQVYVRLPDGRMVIAENSDKGAVGKTFEDLKHKRAYNREISADPLLKAQRLDGFRRNQQRTEAAISQTSSVLRSKARAGSKPSAIPAAPVLALPAPAAMAEELAVVEMD